MSHKHSQLLLVLLAPVALVLLLVKHRLELLEQSMLLLPQALQPALQGSNLGVGQGAWLRPAAMATQV